MVTHWLAEQEGKKIEKRMNGKDLKDILSKTKSNEIASTVRNILVS